MNISLQDIQQQISNARSDFEASRAEVINLKQEVARMKSEIQMLRSQRSIAEDKCMTDEVSSYTKHTGKPMLCKQNMWLLRPSMLGLAPHAIELNQKGDASGQCTRNVCYSYLDKCLRGLNGILVFIVLAPATALMLYS